MKGMFGYIEMLQYKLLGLECVKMAKKSLKSTQTCFCEFFGIFLIIFTLAKWVTTTKYLAKEIVWGLTSSRFDHSNRQTISFQTVKTRGSNSPRTSVYELFCSERPTCYRENNWKNIKKFAKTSLSRFQRFFHHFDAF